MDASQWSPEQHAKHLEGMHRGLAYITGLIDAEEANPDARTEDALPHLKAIQRFYLDEIARGDGREVAA
jgi:hypothetical protein